MAEIDDMDLEGMGEGGAEPQEPEIDGGSEKPDDAPQARLHGAEAAEEPAAEAAAPQPGAKPSEPADPHQELEHWRGRATAHYRQLREAQDQLHRYQEQFGQLQAQQQGEPEKPPEYDPDNPAPFLKWQAEQNALQIQQVQQFLMGQAQAGQQQQYEAYIARVDWDGAQRLEQALGRAEGVEGDPDFQDAYKYVMTRAHAYLSRMSPSPEEAWSQLINHNVAWTRERLMAGEDPITAMKEHAKTIGWAPGAVAAPAVQPAAGKPNGKVAAAAKPAAAKADPFRRPASPRAGGVAQPVPKMNEFASEEELFAALDSGALSYQDMQRQLQVVLPGV